jgi:hypothetical protein
MMTERIAKEWLWLLAAAITASALSLVSRGSFWTVGQTGVVLASLCGLSAGIRTTIWAIGAAQRTATR